MAERVVEGWKIEVDESGHVRATYGSKNKSEVGRLAVHPGGLDAFDGYGEGISDVPLPVLRVMLEMWDARQRKEGE